MEAESLQRTGGRRKAISGNDYWLISLFILPLKERERAPRPLPHRPFTRHTHPRLSARHSFLYHCRPTSCEHLAHWIKLALLLFMSGAVPSLALVRLEWERQLSLKLMAGNLQLTSPTAVSSTSFSFSSPFLPFLAFPPSCFVFLFSPPRANQEETEGNGPLVDKTSTLARFSKIAFPQTSGWRPEGRWRTGCVKLSCFHPGLVEKKNRRSLAVGLVLHLSSTLKWEEWNEYYWRKSLAYSIDEERMRIPFPSVCTHRFSPRRL